MDLGEVVINDERIKSERRNVTECINFLIGITEIEKYEINLC
jgi:hypothetical protein